MNDELKKENIARPPIVVVMGHIDHGKTKILDYFRKTKMVESEAGGITQHIGAYVVEHQGKKIVFIDTPGHEAFSKMRSRGARVADIAILVVAADEGVKPQTKEAIRVIKESKLPFIVAFNKIDKPEANPERVKGELAEEEVLVESYGGKIPSLEVSAATGKNMQELLEIILLTAELENLTADQKRDAGGVVIESHLNPQRGITSTLLVRNGELKLGDTILIGRSLEYIKILEDFQGSRIKQAGPSTPVMITGLGKTPLVGDTFQVFADKKSAEEFIKSLPEETAKSSKILPTVEGEGDEKRTIFNIILKTDVTGSKEVLEESLKKLETDKVKLNILRSEVGKINESDAKLALATKLVTIVGFKVGIDQAVRELIRSNKIHVLNNEVIYDLVDQVKHVIEEMLPTKIEKVDLGRAKILKIFKTEGKKQIVGGRCEQGVVKRGAKFEIERMKAKIGKGVIHQLQKEKKGAEEVEQGSEFGALVESNASIQPNDAILITEEQIVKQTL